MGSIARTRSAQVEDSLLPAEQKDSMYSSPSLSDSRGVVARVASRGYVSQYVYARRARVVVHTSTGGGPHSGDRCGDLQHEQHDSFHRSWVAVRPAVHVCRSGVCS